MVDRFADNFVSLNISDIFRSMFGPDLTPTDDVLERLKIPEGQRQNRLAFISEVFYKYLCWQIGSKKLFKVRRLLFNKRIHEFRKFTDGRCIAQIGSKSEGFCMRGSDQDVLVSVAEAQEKKNVTTNVTLEYAYNSSEKHVYPGYVMIEKFQHGTPIGIFPSNEAIKTLFNRQHQMYQTVSHGPASLFYRNGTETDIVLCFTSLTWPSKATEWINRKRYFRWPSEDMIDSIVQNGCHIVPVGSSRSHKFDTEWRLSFCIAEKELIKTFNHTQILVYALLKLILNEKVKQIETIKDSISSYILKTVMLWLVEKTVPNLWIPKNILLCVHLCIRLLIQFVIEEHCPNYFISRNNMFNDRFESIEKIELLEVLCKVANNGFQELLQCETLQHFMKDSLDKDGLLHLACLSTNGWHCVSLIEHLETFPYSDEKTTHKIDLLQISSMLEDNIAFSKLLSNTVTNCKEYIYSLLSGDSSINRSAIHSFFRHPIIKQKSVSAFSHFIHLNNKSLGNKLLYKVNKLQMQLLWKNAKEDIASGKVLLANWLFIQGNYKACLRATDIVVDNLDLRICHNGDLMEDNALFDQMLDHCSDVMDMQYFSTTDIFLPCKSSLLLNELKSFFTMDTVRQFSNRHKLSNASFPLEIYIHFLRCICFHKTGNIQRCEDEYSKMHSAYHSLKGPLSSLYQCSFYMIKSTCNMIRRNIQFDDLFCNRLSMIQHNGLNISLNDVSPLLNNRAICADTGMRPSEWNALFANIFKK